MQASSIDVYATYRCDLRCSHCFVGDLLDTRADLPWERLQGFLMTAQRWAAEEITFLGGEPTLYPDIVRALRLATDLGYRVRLVSNGGPALHRLLKLGEIPPATHIALSIDGSSAERHDGIRHRRSFGNVFESLELAAVRGHTVSGNLSVGTYNIDDAKATLVELGQYPLTHVNVHYVTNRGAASAGVTIGVGRWLALKDELKATNLGLKVRFEDTFVPRTRQISCRAAEETMLMLFPDLRVFTCSMFLHLIEGNAFEWSCQNELLPNPAFRDRYMQGGVGCPAITHVSPELADAAAALDLAVGCIFDKQVLGDDTGGRQAEY